VVASVAFICEAVFMGIAPYLGGPVPAAVSLGALGILNGFANIITITAFQRWARPGMLGRLMGLLMLASMGTFPVSVVIGGVIVNSLGPAIFFPIAATTIALAVLAGLSQPSWRAFGAREASD
jgi:hypothetical protein